MWECPPRIWPERHETCNQLGIDPLRFGACAPAGCKGFDLGWRQLSRGNSARIQCCPQTPLLPSVTRGYDLPDRILILATLKANQRTQLKSKLSELCATFRIIRDPQALALRQTMNIQPVARDIYADNTFL